MNRAVEQLNKSNSELNPKVLESALLSEQSAYQGLLRLRAREHQVVRNNQRQNQQQQSGQQNQSRQQQMEQAPAGARRKSLSV